MIFSTSLFLAYLPQFIIVLLKLSIMLVFRFTQKCLIRLLENWLFWILRLKVVKILIWNVWLKTPIDQALNVNIFSIGKTYLWENIQIACWIHVKKT